MNSIKNNFIYMVVYYILSMIVPLITAPYLARTIGAEGVGIYSYTYSIVNYFMLFTLLGVNNYGNRRIAQVRNDKKLLSKEFWNIFSMQVLTGFLMLIVYMLYIVLYKGAYSSILILEIGFIFSAIIDINWFFFGKENFKATISRNVLLKFGNLLLILFFVKDISDIYIYTLIMVLTTLISQLIMWSFLIKEVQYVKPSWCEIKKHMKPNLVLFVPVVAVSVYKIMDKVMLGVMTNVVEVGYYENAEKIINIPATIITALGTVMLPRVSNMISNGQEHKVKIYIQESLNFMLFLAFPIAFGLGAISEMFVPLFLGKEFYQTGYLLILLGSTIPIVCFANVIRTEYLIPKEMDNIFLTSSVLGAIVNVVINFLLIPIYKSIGACIGTIIAELTVMIYQTIKVRHCLDIKKYCINILPFFIKSLLMFLLIYPIKYININEILIVVIQVLLGMIIYGILNINYILKKLKAKTLKGEIKNG